MIEIFVFGSNLAGRHGKGAALEARQHWGAQYGQAQGRQGRSYAIPTKDRELRTLPLGAIEDEIDVFLAVARSTQESCTYRMTRIGCGLAGYQNHQIAGLFTGKDIPPNVIMPPEWKEFL